MPVKLMFVVAEDWYFYSHRLPIARAALQSGFEVVVATRVNAFAHEIEKEGFRVIPLSLKRESASPASEWQSIRELREIYKAERPDLIHHVALKPILYGSIAALGKPEMKVVNAWAGLGYLVSSSSFKARILRLLIWSGLSVCMRSSNYHVLFQNDDDRDLLARTLRLPVDKTSVIRGAGVDLSRFFPMPEPEGTPVVMLPSRMLWNKGVKEFVMAASLIKAGGLPVRFVLVGDTDVNSPASISHAQLLEWLSRGDVEWWGFQSDMPSTLARANIICLPSYREGLPKVLMEAAASARAIVTTDVPGCRDVVRHGINGLLVEPTDIVGLRDAILTLVRDPLIRRQMGLRGREIAAKEFSESLIASQTLALYRRLLGQDACHNGHA